MGKTGTTNLTKAELIVQLNGVMKSNQENVTTILKLRKELEELRAKHDEERDRRQALEGANERYLGFIYANQGLTPNGARWGEDET